MKNTISFFFAYAIIFSCVSFSQINTEHRFPFIEREILNSPAKQNNLVLFKNPDHVTNNSNSDSIITAVISHINKDSVQYFIQSLQDLGTRYMLAPNRDSVARRIKSEFHRIGFTDVKLDSFQYEGTWQQNVVATLPGRLNTDYNVLIGGHYDSYSSGDPTVFAPGADDDASGTAAVLEVARAIISSGYIPDVTIRFIAFAAEELGLWGSKHYAETAVNEGMKIKIIINHDMISYNNLPLADSKVKISYGNSTGVKNLAVNFVQNYTPLTTIANPGAGPDDEPFYEAGYKNLFFMEEIFSPYYHSPQDLVENHNMEYCTEIIKASGAILLKISDMPFEVVSFLAEDIGDGQSVKLSWAPNIESDLTGYKIYVTDSSGTLNTFYTSDTVKIIDGLSEGMPYRFGISAVDINQNESFLSESGSTPNSAPLPPATLTDKSLWHKIKLDWKKNKELDLAGYNIYRSEFPDGSFAKLNTTVLSDTTYADESVTSGKYYFYYVKAVDLNSNESPASQVVRSMSVSLSKGILVVDETSDGNGSLFNPTDEQVDLFYDAILSDFRKNSYDIKSEGGLKLADIGAYSTIIWVGNDNNDYAPALNSAGAIADYLGYGGNFLYTGFSAARSFHPAASTTSFSAGDFIYDYLKIDSTRNSLLGLFIGAEPVAGLYNPLNVDSAKSSSTTNYHIRKVDNIFSSSDIYTYKSNYSSSTAQGILKGKPVGAEYLGADFKAITLNIPLYYIKMTEAKELISRILSNKFNEPMEAGDKEISQIPSGFRLLQNHPNPFNPNTVISYQLAVNSYVKVIVYDIKGEVLEVLVKENKPAGYYEIEFNGGKYASGMYFCRLIAGNYVKTIKMSLVK